MRPPPALFFAAALTACAVPAPAQSAGRNVTVEIQTDDGRILLFDRGWVPSERKDPATRAAGQLPGRVDLVGGAIAAVAIAHQDTFSA